MKHQYNTEVTPLLKTFRKITVSEKKYAKIIEHVEKLIAIKIHEPDYKVDHDKLRERFITGLLGEAALEELLKIHIIEWKIALHASDFNHPDIPSFGIGVKTAQEGNYHIIYKQNNYPQIFCIRSSESDKDIYICGLATADILRKYQDTDLILNANLRRKGYKTGFWGHQHLLPISSVKDIEKYRLR